MASNRKQELLALLKGAKESMNGQSLAEHFGVTRQIIVQDIALLRADGAQIISTNRGYIYKSSDDNSYVHRLFKCPIWRMSFWLLLIMEAVFKIS